MLSLPVVLWPCGEHSFPILDSVFLKMAKIIISEVVEKPPGLPGRLRNW